MGFVGSASTLSLTAKMTPYGKSLLLSQPASAVIKKFSLGDSDANYYTSVALTTGQVPEISGDYNTNGDKIYNTGFAPTLNSNLYHKGLTSGVYKSIPFADSFISDRVIKSADKTISGSNLNFRVLDKTNDVTGHTNYFKTLGLPLTTTEKGKYDKTLANGGYLNTILKDIDHSNAILVSVNASQYGDMIDGKNFKLQVPISDGGVTTDKYIYSTYIKGNGTNNQNDAKYKEDDARVAHLGDNMVLLYSDDVQRPNKKSGNSWSTKHGTLKPFTNGKSYANYTTNLPNNSDIAVGVLHLDSGLAVITHPNIVNNIDKTTKSVYNSDGSYYYSATTSGSSSTFSYVTSDVAYNVVFKAEREEFYKSSNTTFNSATDTVRISEIGIYDNQNKLVAVSKLDRHVEKLKYDTLVFTVKFKI